MKKQNAYYRKQLKLNDDTQTDNDKLLRKTCQYIEKLYINASISLIVTFLNNMFLKLTSST